MKKFYSTLVFLLILNFSAIAQIKSNYERGFGIGFKEGYCYSRNTYNCLPPLTPLSPLPRINESSSNYTEGYNRGFQYGLDLKRSNDASRNSDNLLNQKVASFNRYVPQNPVEAMRVVGMIRQQKYDARKEWIQQKIYQFEYLRNSLFNVENFPVGFDTFTHKNNLRNTLLEYIADISAYDYGDDYVFRNIQIELNNIENYHYTYYNSIVESATKKQLEQEKLQNINSEKEKLQNINLSVSGKVSFWKDFTGTSEMHIYLDDKYIGTFTSYFDNVVPLCGQDGTITVSRNPGTYNFKVVNDKSTWIGTVTVNKGECVLHGLTLKK
jgi:hypothetical protein